MSNLASIQKITALNPIEGADKIEVADILGWKVVVKKEQFKVGDLCAYVQIDTICPEIPFFEFLKDRDFRVRTIKLRKQISQGLALSIDNCITIQNELKGPYISLNNIKEGDDVTEWLQIKKYSKEIVTPENQPKMPKKWYKKWLWLFKQRVLVKVFPNLKQVNRRPFPNELVSKTDEERIQNIPWVIQKYANKPMYITEKVDGSSITIIYDEVNNLIFGKKKIYRICSRNFELFDKKNEWYKVFIDTDFKQYIDTLVEVYNTRKIIVQGEYIGKPQGNPYKLDNNEIRVFNIFVNGKKLKPLEFNAVCTKFHIPRVPKDPWTGWNENATMEDLLKSAEGKSILNNNTEREGVVVRDEGGTISFKIISNKFLLKNNE